MKTDAWLSWRNFDDWMAVADVTWAGELAAAAGIPDPQAMSGRCGLCDRDAVFFSDPKADSTRETLSCSCCGASARQRATAMALFAALPRPRQSIVYATEHASSFYVWLRKRIGRLLGSEYGIGLRRRLQMSTWLWRSRIWELVRIEDVTALSFRDAKLDAIVCQDVLEHVPDYRAALREFVRVLRPAGTLLLTVPFYHGVLKSKQIAFVDDNGHIDHVGEPEYHGDPVGGGVLCYHHFAWDLLDAMREAGFAHVDACRVHDIERGLPQGQWILRATR